MRRTFFLIMALALLSAPGCATKTGSATAGAVGGAALGGGTYEYRMNEELKRIEQEYKAGKMDQKEYEIRKDEIMRMSIIK